MVHTLLFHADSTRSRFSGTELLLFNHLNSISCFSFQFASVETIVVVITDQVHGLRRYSTLVTLVACITMFGLGLLLCTDVR